MLEATKIKNENLILLLNLNEECSVEDLVDNFFQQKRLVNLTCKFCNSTDFKDEHFIEALPDFFVLVIERYPYDEKRGFFMKNKKSLILNQNINFGKYLIDNREDINYRLFSFIEHLGENLEYGHAISICRNSNDEKFTRFNDTLHEELSNELMKMSLNKNENAYILFYEKLH